MDPKGEECSRGKQRQRDSIDQKKLVDAAFFFFFPFNFAPYLRSERGVQILGAVHVTLDEGLESGRGVKK